MTGAISLEKRRQAIDKCIKEFCNRPNVYFIKLSAKKVHDVLKLLNWFNDYEREIENDKIIEFECTFAKELYVALVKYDIFKKTVGYKNKDMKKELEKILGAINIVLDAGDNLSNIVSSMVYKGYISWQRKQPNASREKKKDKRFDEKIDKEYQRIQQLKERGKMVLDADVSELLAQLSKQLKRQSEHACPQCNKELLLTVDMDSSSRLLDSMETNLKTIKTTIENALENISQKSGRDPSVMQLKYMIMLLAHIFDFYRQQLGFEENERFHDNVDDEIKDLAKDILIEKRGFIKAALKKCKIRGHDNKSIDKTIDDAIKNISPQNADEEIPEPLFI